MKLPRLLSLPASFILEAFQYVSKNPISLLRIPEIRDLYAHSRLNSIRQEDGGLPLEVFSGGETPDIIENTIKHNVTSLNPSIARQRPIGLLGPLLGMDQVMSSIPTTRILIIGPRTEAEILWYISEGFNPANITALDLHSYSDYITCGDMHQIPFDDNSFDIVIFSWVLAYSSNQLKAVSEAIRVLKRNGLLGIGEQWDPAPIEWTSKTMEETAGYSLACTETKSVNGLLRLLDGFDYRLVFQTEPLENQRDRVGWISIIAQVK